MSEHITAHRIAAAKPARPRARDRAPIRPLMLSYYFDPIYAGSAIQAYTLARALQRLGAEPSIVAANFMDSPAYEEYGGVPLYRLPCLKAEDLRRPTFWASLAQFLAQRRRQFDVIHGHGTGPHAIIGPYGRLLRIPTILKIAMAGSDINFVGHGRILGRVNRSLIRQIDCYIATTKAIESEFGPAGLDPRRVRLIPNGVDTEANRPLPSADREALRATLGLPAGPLVSTVGIVIQRKNVDGALRSFHTVTAQGAPGHFLIIGPMPEEHAAYHEELKAYVATHGLQERVSFLGFRTPVSPYVQASDIFLFPSRQEGMPNSVLEAMACGLPCIVSNSAGVESSVVTDGATGFAIDLDDERAFAETLGRLMTDEPLRRRVGDSARQAIMERFSMDVIARRYLDLYHQLLGLEPSSSLARHIAHEHAGGRVRNQ